MSEKDSPSRRKIGLSDLGPITLSNLASFYLHSRPEKNEQDFMQEIVVPMWNNDSTSGENLLEEIKAIQEKDKTANMQFASMLISCAFCVQSMKALKGNDRELAWSYMADARYWCGVVLSSKGIEVARSKTIVATRKNLASIAAKGKFIKKVKEEAFRLAKEKRPKTNGWRSRRHAAETIEKEVYAFAVAEKINFSEKRAFKTIYEWLREMPDAALLFPKKQGKPEDATESL